jgi:Transcriptional regulator SbtR-like, C-terminal domain
MSERLLERPDPGAALADWLRAFVDHVATNRELAQALPDDSGRASLFASWHTTMEDAASQLVARAREAGTVRTDPSAHDLLTLATAIARTGLPATRIDTLLELIRDGYRSKTRGGKDLPT